MPMRTLAVVFALACVFAAQAENLRNPPNAVHLAAEGRAAAPGPAPGPAGPGGPGMFNLDEFANEWHHEWRHGDYPDYKQTYQNGGNAAKFEDRQSDQKQSTIASGLP
eukprot:gnl/TRDRNA2_/TRDRNA2_169217_c0_seq11.p2 gnl/TRDRNA2_/TRDRNA2_169217_c0~~gnl/TRDRNA2_/TRDRNA2_169217_c0_seq11.p2  ORF type:complete len:108 (+),score=23.17 gnl/TRDRNA2_/TRDRNA2_169217_c0_seq11:80-403(+)